MINIQTNKNWSIPYYKGKALKWQLSWHCGSVCYQTGTGVQIHSTKHIIIQFKFIFFAFFEKRSKRGRYWRVFKKLLRFHVSSCNYLGNLLPNLYTRQKKVVLKLGHPRNLFSLFSSFQTNITIFTTNKCGKSPSSRRCWDSNPRPLEHESPPLTTSLGSYLSLPKLCKSQQVGSLPNQCKNV